MYVINNITISLVLPYFGISNRPKNFDSFHQTVLSLEVHVGYRMHCTSEKLISNEQHGHKEKANLSYGIFVEMILDVTRRK